MFSKNVYFETIVSQYLNSNIFALMSKLKKNGRNFAFYSKNKISFTCILVNVLSVKAFI